MTAEPTPQKSKWEVVRDMKWPIVVLVALVGLFNSNLAKDLGDALNKPDIIAPDGSTKPADITPEEINNLIVKTIEAVLPKLLPKPDGKTTPVTPVVTPVAPDPTKPVPVTPVTPDSKTIVTDDGLLGILVTNEEGRVVTASTVDAGQLFRVSAKNAKGKVAWQTSKHGDVRILASTDGTEYFGYLKDGQWIEFGLTDFGSQKQVSLRISCNQGPQPPPVDPVTPVEPVVDNTNPVPSKGPVSLFVLYDKNLPASAAAILTSTDVWNSFKKDGSEWRFIAVSDESVLGMKIKNDNGSTKIPSLLIYEKASMSLLASQPLPRTIEEVVSVVTSYTGSK